MENLPVPSDKEICALYSGDPITDRWPWSTRDECIVEKYIKNIVEQINERLNLLSLVRFKDWSNHIDAWFYRPNEEFRYATSGNYYYGLRLLTSYQSSHFVMGESSRSWEDDPTRNSGSLMCLESVDKFSRPEVVDLVEPCCEILRASGLTRLSRNQLSQILPEGIEFPESLTFEAKHHFDALFFYVD